MNEDESVIFENLNDNTESGNFSEGAHDSSPQRTKWVHSRCCICFPAIYIPKIGKYFMNHWEVSLAMPISVTVIIIFSYIVCTWIALPFLHLKSNVIHFCLSSVMFFLFEFCYIQTISEGPGYFPFDWESRNSDVDEPDGIVSLDSQERWARVLEKPPRCIYSRKARRIVIRPDHECIWTATWIGKRNHKFFILFNVYGTIYILHFSFIMMLSIIKTFGYETYLSLLFLVCLIAALIFLFLVASFSVMHLRLMINNTTSWERWNHISEEKYDRGSIIKNSEDICGPSSNMLMWVLPTSPFKDKSNDFLVKDYPHYYS